MILKLCKMGGIDRHVECIDVLTQPTNSGLWDVEAVQSGGRSLRFLVGESDGSEFRRAYLMENGKTVDTIGMAHSLPPKEFFNGPSFTQSRHRAMNAPNKGT